MAKLIWSAGVGDDPTRTAEERRRADEINMLVVDLR
jgi:hypothetical protein